MGISLLLSTLKGKIKSNKGKGDKKFSEMSHLFGETTRIHLTVTQQIHNNEIPNMLLIETAMCVFHFGALWMSLCGADKQNDTVRIKRTKLNKQVASSPGAHLTSTSPPTCITNEPSGCFTDHRKSNSFSLESRHVCGEERSRRVEDMDWVKEIRREKERGRETVEI